MAYRLYKATAPNGKCYIGITKLSLKQRVSIHFSAAKRQSKTRFAAALRKYGDEIKFETLAVGCQEYILDLEEKAIIAFNSRIPNGYNIIKGGAASPALDPIVRAKISASQKGRKRGPQSPEHIAARVAGIKRVWAKRKKPPTRLGAKTSDETKRKMSEAAKGRVISKAQREKASKAHKGVKETPESIEARRIGLLKSWEGEIGEQRRKARSEMMKVIWAERRKAKAS